MKTARVEVLALFDDCEVLPATHSQGYARVTYEGERVFAHRLAFFKANGYWPEVCRHKCDNPPCVNPNHLEDGTHKDNMRDMMSRGRGKNQFLPGYRGGRAIPEQRSANKVRMGKLKTHCKRGHVLPEYAPGTTRRCMEPECREARRYNALGGIKK